MRYLSMLLGAAGVALVLFLVDFVLFLAGGWAECDRGDCGPVGEAVWAALPILFWLAAALAVAAGVSLVVRVLRR